MNPQGLGRFRRGAEGKDDTPGLLTRPFPIALGSAGLCEVKMGKERKNTGANLVWCVKSPSSEKQGGSWLTNSGRKRNMERERDKRCWILHVES